MAFRKQSLLAFALLALSAIALGCAEETTAPNTQNEAPVLAPVNVQATVVNRDDIQISWDPSSQPNVAGYNLYRLDTANSAIGRLNQSRIEATHYTDETAVSGHEYEYRVTAVTVKGGESRYASVVIRNRVPLGDRKGDVPGTEQ
jgi:hypothetical protein